MTDVPDWPAADPLGEALHFLRMSGSFYCRSEMSAPWGVAMPALADCLMFHAVSSGRCWLEVEGTEPRLLQPGDLALVPHGRGHRLVSTPGALTADLFDLPREQVSERYEVLRHGGGGTPAVVVCGAVRIHRDPARGWTLAELAGEAAMSRSAFAARFTALVGVPAMQYLTQWRMNVALAWLQRHEVGVAELAARLGYQSEAAFSRAFKRFVGVSPGAVRRTQVG